MNGKSSELKKHLAAILEEGGDLHQWVLELRSTLEKTQEPEERISLCEIASDAYTALCAVQEGQGDLTAALASCRAIQQMKEEAFRLKLEALAGEHDTLERRFKEASQQKTELLERVSQQAKLLQRQAREDVLTGLHNRRFLDEQLWLEFERARRDQQPLCVLMIDINRFKKINDLFSHKVGDVVLQNVGKILRAALRRNDFAARYGGDEFAVYLPETTGEEAERICEQIHAAVAAFPWGEEHPNLEVSLSIGWADSQGKEDYEALLHAADEQLYRVKMDRNDHPSGGIEMQPGLSS